MPKVLISDKMSPLAEECFKARGIEVDVKTGMTPDELIACIRNYDGLGCIITKNLGCINTKNIIITHICLSLLRISLTTWNVTKLF